jgi:hypothetical protein
LPDLGDLVRAVRHGHVNDLINFNNLLPGLRMSAGPARKGYGSGRESG